MNKICETISPESSSALLDYCTKVQVLDFLTRLVLVVVVFSFFAFANKSR